jgi:hypothetical protein
MDTVTTDRLLAVIEEQGKKIDDIALSVRRVRQYMFWTAVVTVAFFVLPLIGLAFVLPSYVSTLTAGLTGL